MDLLICLVSAALGTPVQPLSLQGLLLDGQGGKAAWSRMIAGSLSNAPNADMAATIKLLPYEILAGTATSYADIVLTLVNTSLQDLTLEVTQIAIVEVDAGRVLMQADPPAFGLPQKVVLQPGARQSFQYRLQEKAKRYRSDQPVQAQIHYRRGRQPEQIILSSPETVTFMIP